nr:hypothetical protein [Candidatus Aenigmarchaeota archaeon]
GGWYHSLALLDTGEVVGWGYNEYGQLGDGTSGNEKITPVYVLKGATPGNADGHLAGVVAIAGGAFHSLATLDTDEVASWGRNDSNQLGDNSGTNKSSPVYVLKGATPGNADGRLTGVVAIESSYDFSLALLDTSEVVGWGPNLNGQLGDGTNNNKPTPVYVTKGATPGNADGRLTGVVAIAAGSFHSLAVLDTDEVASWGYNWYGQLGNGNSGGPADESSPVYVLKGATPGNADGRLTGVVAIAAGGPHSLATLDTDEVAGWGNNNDGQVGDGTSGNERITPVYVVKGATPGNADGRLTGIK